MARFLSFRPVYWAVVIGFAHVVLAVPVAYEIDPERSELTASGFVMIFGTANFAEQSPGSLIGRMQGTIIADPFGEGLTFDGGSLIDAAPHPSGPFRPEQGDVGSTALEDNFGAQDNATGNIFQAALRDVQADILSGTALFGETADELEFKVIHGAIDVVSLAGGFSGSFDLSTTLQSAPNISPNPLLRVVASTTETITLPVLVNAPFVAEPEPAVIVRGQFNLEGQIVATRRLSLPGDTNGDLTVDIDDLNNVRNNFGAAGSDDGTLPGDAFPFDGRVNIDDLNSVRNHFGTLSSAVPEPSGLFLSSLTVFVLFSFARRSIPRSTCSSTTECGG
jgi:hypothetical protein